MIREFIADALYWKYYKEGSSIRTRQLEDGSWEIFEWRITDNTPQPSEAEILKCLEDYKLHLTQSKQSKKLKRESVLAKLKITEEDLADLLKG